MRVRLTVAILTIGSVSVGTASAARAAVAPAGTFTVRMVNADPTDATVHPYFTLSLGAGQTATQHVEVGNPTDASVSLVVDGVEGRTAQTSGAVYANRKDKLRRAGKWVTPLTRRVTVAPHTNLSIGFTVKVPAGTHAGDHLAGIAVQNTEPATSGNGFKIRQILRTVLGVLVTVPGPATFHPHVFSAGIAKLPGLKVASVSVRIADDGRALGKPLLRIALTGPKHYSRTVSRQLDTLLPVDVISYQYAWPDALASGKYSITVSLTGGGTTADYHTTVTLGAALRGVETDVLGSETRRSQAGSSGMPWSIVAMLGLVGVGIVLVRRPGLRAFPPIVIRPDGARRARLALGFTVTLLAMVIVAAVLPMVADVPVLHAPAFAAGVNTAYVVSNGPDTVTPIDTAGNAGTAIPVGTDPYAVAFSPDGTKAYVTNIGSNTVTPITVATGTAGTEILVGTSPYGVAFSPDGSTAYVANAGSNTVTPITVATDTPARRHQRRQYSARSRVQPRRRQGIRHQHRLEHSHADHRRHRHRGDCDHSGSDPVGRGVQPRRRQGIRHQHLVEQGDADHRGDEHARCWDHGRLYPGRRRIQPRRHAGLCHQPDVEHRDADHRGDQHARRRNLRRRKPVRGRVQPRRLGGLRREQRFGHRHTDRRRDQHAWCRDSGRREPAGRRLRPRPSTRRVVHHRRNAHHRLAGQLRRISVNRRLRHDRELRLGLRRRHERLQHRDATTTHTYASTGGFTARVTETSSAGTSTTRVFTGQTMSRNGGPSATTTRGLTVATDLSLTAPATVTFADTLDGHDQTAVASPAFDVASSDVAGWSVTATSTQFTTGARTLTTDAVSVQSAPTITCQTTCTLATNAITYPYSLPAGSTAPTATKIFSAAQNTGIGSQTITPTFRLAIPANTYTGNYLSTWTFTVSTGP